MDEERLELPSPAQIYDKRKEVGCIDIESGMQIRVNGNVYDLKAVESHKTDHLLTQYKRIMNMEYQDRVREMANFVRGMRNEFERKLESTRNVVRVFPIGEQELKNGWLQSANNSSAFVYIPKTYEVETISMSNPDKEWHRYHLKNPRKNKCYVCFQLQFDVEKNTYTIIDVQIVDPETFKDIPFQFHNHGSYICSGDMDPQEEFVSALRENNNRIYHRSPNFPEALEHVADLIAEMLKEINMDDLALNEDTDPDDDGAYPTSYMLENFAEEFKLYKAVYELRDIRLSDNSYNLNLLKTIIMNPDDVKIEEATETISDADLDGIDEIEGGAWVDKKVIETFDMTTEIA